MDAEESDHNNTTVHRSLDTKRNELPDHSTQASSSSSSSSSSTYTYSCRIPFRAMQSIVRNRKRMLVQSLRITATDRDATYVQFEFTFHRSQTTASSASASLHYNPNNNNNYNNKTTTSTGSCTMVQYKIHVAANCRGVVCAGASTTIQPSEIVSAPIIWSRLLEPLQHTSEAAFILRNNHQNDQNNNNNNTAIVSASSFHPESIRFVTNRNTTDGTNGSGAGSTTTIRTPSSSVVLFQSETAVAVNEFLEFDFISNREQISNNNEFQLPEHINEEVILVFSLKECRALLYFLCGLDDSIVTLTFHYGGQPMVFKSNQSSWSVNLVLATLDHKLLSSLHTQQRNV